MERTLAAGGLPDMDQRLRHRRNHGFAGQLASTAVNGLFEALGANGGALSNPVQRAWRDINVAVRHISLHWPATAAMYGQHRFGLPPKGQF
jgi:alkylation response protein AidB-like acyl-CoA dehydrogenase